MSAFRFNRNGVQFPLALFAAAFLLCAAPLCVQTWLVWTLDASLASLNKREFRLGKIAGELAALDERLTMSASMAAATGAPEWERSYREAEPRLQALLNEAEFLMRGSLAEASIKTIAAANKSLVLTDRSSLELSRAGRLFEADALLRDNTYAARKRQFHAGLHDLIKAVDANAMAALNTSRNFSAAAIVAGALCLIGLLACALTHVWVSKRSLAALALTGAERETIRAEYELRMAEARAEMTVVNKRLTAEIEDRTKIEERLTAYGARLQNIVESMDNGLAVFEPVDGGEDFIIREFNAAAERIENISRRDVLGVKLSQAFPGAKAMGMVDALNEALRTGRPVNLPISLYKDNRVEAWRENYIFKLPSGEAAALYADLTEAKRAEEALIQSEERHRNLYNNTPVMLHSIDRQGRLISVSDFWLAAMGYERGEVLGKKSSDFLTEESRRYAKEVVLPEFFQTGTCHDVPYQMRTKSGAIMDVRLSATSERDASGEIVRSLAVLVDVTEQIKAEAALRESEERLSLAVLGGKIGFWDWDRRTDEVFYSELWAAILGHNLSDLETNLQTWTSRLHPDDGEKAVAALDACLCGNKAYFESEHRLRAKDGTWRWVMGVGRVSSRNEDGSPKRVTGTMIDIGPLKAAEERLAVSERRFRDVALTSGDWVWEVGADGRYVYASDSIQRIMGYDPEELRGKTPFDLMPPDEAERVGTLFTELIGRKAPIQDMENWNLAKDGRRVCLLTNGVPILDEKGGVAGYFGVDKDITSRKQSESQLKLFGKVFESALEGISITDEAGTIVAVNPAFTEITGYQPGEVLGGSARLLQSDRHEQEFYRDMWKTLQREGRWEGEIWNQRKNGEAYPGWFSICALKEDSGAVGHYVAVFHDITEIKRKEEQIQHQAYHDPLTDLPNRALYKDRLGVSIAHAKRTGSKAAVIMVDLDNFKNINDSLGHAVGDDLLLLVAERFMELTRPGDTLARLGGDEFGFLLDNLDHEDDAVKLAERIIASLGEPFPLGGHELFITPSIGLAAYPGDGDDSETLMKNADAAMYQAKELGRNRYRLFRVEMNERASRRLTLENSLRKALSNEEFFLVYQPKVNILSGRVAGMEALVRWERQGEVVSPMEFIPLAEETGLIIPLGRQVLDMACLQAPEMFRLGQEDMRVAVNLSPRQFAQPDIVDMVTEILSRRKIAPERLDLEITETAIAGDIENSVKKLHTLHDMGIHISVDDFGTGYSSLAYLKRFPISTIKIDRSFITGLGTANGDENIVRAIIQLARNFGMTVVAEGVETKDQLALLKYYGCDQVQGYFYSRPLPLEDFLAFLHERIQPEGPSRQPPGPPPHG